MKSFLVVLILPLLGSAGIAATISTPPAADRDIDSSPASPTSSLDTAARQAAGGQTNAADPATHATTPAPAAPATPQAPAGSQAVPVEPLPSTVAPAATPASASELPAMPVAATEGTTQIGGLDLEFENAPLEAVMRRLVDQLGRPVNISVARTIRVTGKWEKSTALQILRDIAMKYDLVLRDTPVAYVLEDSGRDFALQAATVTPQHTAPSTSALSADLFADGTIRSVPVVARKDRAAIDAALAKEEAKALQRREQLQREANR